MRYQQIDNLLFTTIRGKTVQIKDMRELPSYQTLAEYKMQDGDDLDEIVSREIYYGSNAESATYLLAEHNAVKLWESKFDVSALRTVKIPVAK
jgi:hypothetical protein